MFHSAVHKSWRPIVSRYLKKLPFLIYPFQMFSKNNSPPPFFFLTKESNTFTCVSQQPCFFITELNAESWIFYPYYI